MLIPLNPLNNRMFDFQGNILGFEDYSQYHLQVMDEEGTFATLQSAQDEHVGFLVANPFVFYPEYSIEVSEQDKQILSLESQDQALVLGIITVRKPFAQSTINLLAPLILNIESNLGKQIVLPPRSIYGTKEPLFKNMSLESRDDT